MRVLFVQYSGDYRQAVQHFSVGQQETYYAQKYSVDSVAKLSEYAEEVAVLCCLSAEKYDETLPNGVRAIGAGFSERIDFTKVIQFIEQFRPTHLIIRIPNKELFDWAIQKKVKTIALFAESILTKGWRNKIKNYRLVKLLNHPQIEWVGSYGITSSLVLQNLGVDAKKIIPWDFLLETHPGSLVPKPLREADVWNLLYVGSMLPAKGVGDILEAVVKLKARNIHARLQMVGKDADGLFLRQAEQLGIANQVEFLGVIANHQVEPLMREADLVIVPSHHSYPEGFPLVIHHALRSRTPIVASDHPMFRNSLSHGSSAMVFPAGNSTALANCVEKVVSDAELYYSLSVRSYETWQKLRLPVKWADVLDRWLDDAPENKRWLSSYQVSSDCYQEKKAVPLVANQLLQA
ncbi:MAG TPA: glycosyltransferase [Coleofasciculaceae cyanobacterium]|jgi:glycosyltransferase involved in cell wall biosynthesis